jgi:FAD/FMN-containing dehydrogenase
MAADHVLSMEVVTTDGRFITASADQNNDLFWALRGGGGSTFGIVTSMVVKAYPTIPVTTVTFSFSSGGNITIETFYAGVRAYFNYFIPHTEAGLYSYFHVYAISNTSMSFDMAPIFAPNLNETETMALLSPWFAQLASLGFEIVPTVTTFTSFYDAWEAAFPLEDIGYSDDVFGSRLFPRSNWEDETLLNSTFEAIWTSLEAGLFVTSFNIAPTLANGDHPDNSVNPAWRNTVMHCIQTIVWDNNATPEEIIIARNLLTERQEAFKNVSIGAGSYLGEGDREEPDFQQSFYGAYYDRLQDIKRKYDPWNVLWAKNAVGSEVYQVATSDVIPDENGRLCKS